MEAMSPVHLGIIISLGFLPMLLLRPLIVNSYINKADLGQQPKKAFFLDFAICIGAAILINIYDAVVLDFPLYSLSSLLIGCIIVGFFIGLDSSLTREREIILQAIEQEEETPLPKNFFPMTRKFTLVAITTAIFVSLVLVLVFTRDVVWLAKTAQDAASIASAQMSITYEIFFIMTVLMILIVNLIFSYSKNLKLLFNTETGILEKVSNGDLTSKVPVVTNDEFGVIAGHTNQMIEGLRHRFELINALKLAEEVQQNLLPSKSPYLRGYDISGFSLYCDQTGGDYYDYFLLPDEKFGVVVADACGHGIGAAMLMTSVRAFLISAIQNYKDPATLMNQINMFITKDCAVSGRFTTMFFLEINQTTGKFQWIRAGHDPALFYHAQTEQFTKLDGSGLVLGVEDSFVFEPQETGDVSSGDIILIGTDGIHETRDQENNVFGQGKVQNIIARHRNDTAQVIQQALVDEVREFRGILDQEDDITLVVIKVL